MTTAVAPPPPAPDPAPEPPRPRTPSTPARVKPAGGGSGGRSLTSDLLATGTLALYSAAVAAGYARVFAGWDFFDNMLVLVVLGHGVGLLLRRARVTGWLAVPIVAIVLGWAIGAIHYRFTYSMLLPTAETLDLFRSELGLVREQFRTAVAPVLYGGGWDVLAAIGLAAAILLADTFAFRAFARAEALVPGGVLFVFVAALGADRSRVALSVALIAAGVLVTVVLRAYHAPRVTAAMGSRRNRISLALPAGVVSALVISLTAGYVGPRLPGADSDALYDTKGRGSGSVTEIVSPLVDIRSRLTNRGNAELFVVQANFASYWRSSALPQFDGTTWGLPERALSSVEGTLTEPRERTETLRQRVRITALGGSLVPAAADPQRASPDTLRWSEDTATLVKVGEELQPGETFDIISASPRFDQATLQAATSTDAGDPIYLELPDDWPESVARTARDVVDAAGATTPYETAVALQNWFRDPNEWSYSLEVQSGHGTNAVESFLRERVGYCEQFAGTYAAMMRSLGYPARVSVGFTPGTNLGNGSYSVLGKNAHAWPEVWFDGLGWVPFEPTPGRGSPDAQEYTGVAPQQDDSGVDPDAPRESLDETAPVPSFPEPAGVPQDQPLNIPQADLDDFPGGAEGGEGAVPEDRGDGFNWAGAVVVLLLVAALVAPAIVRTVRRRLASKDPEAQLNALWQRSIDSLTDVGLEPDPTHTPLETAAETADRFPIAARPITELAETLTAAAYSRNGTAGFTDVGSYGSSTMRSCSNWARQIDRAVRDTIGIPTRVKRYFTRWR